VHELGQHGGDILSRLQRRVHLAGNAAVVMGLLEGSVAVPTDIAQGLGRLGLRPLIEEHNAGSVDDVSLQGGKVDIRICLMSIADGPQRGLKR
jgi:hypothetical protein